MDAETFRDRMKATAVRNETGALLLVHHATYAVCEADDFAPFTHFGTRAAARARVPDKEARLVSAYLDIRNPLMVSDIDDDHSPEHIAEIIEEAHPGLIGDCLEEIFDLEPGQQEEFLIEVLQEAGYDGLGYRNRHEDPGSMSWMIFSPVQICLHRDGPATTRDPWELDLATYIGPSIVADVFSIDGGDESYEHLLEALVEEGGDLHVVARSPEGWEARWLDDWEPEATLGLFAPSGEPMGFYMSGQVWVNPAARGEVRSALMINAAADILGGCPSQNTQGMGFSPAGYAAHNAAHGVALENRRLCEKDNTEPETSNLQP